VRTSVAAAGTSVFFVVAPAVVAGLVPWLITRWEVGDSSFDWALLRVAGAVLLAIAIVVLVHAFVRFVVEGAGTPAPVAPTEHLVVGGLYRFVRNPMYVAVVGAIVGQALVLVRPALLIYAAFMAIAFAAFVHFYEEPTLARRFGTEYDTYRRAVSAWWPRVRPWKPENPELSA
jgi:protein-S-isoprenylcysteine O-methyltransferase Ste14